MRVTRDEAEAIITTGVLQGLSDTAIARQLALPPSTARYWRIQAGWTRADKFPGRFERRHGPGSFAVLCALLDAGAAITAIGHRFGFRAEYARQLRVRLNGSPLVPLHAQALRRAASAATGPRA